MNLSKNFTLEELCTTNVSLPNLPDQQEIRSLQLLVKNILQPLRELYGKPIKINSGFRSLAVNKSVGGVLTSQHTKGEAADISCDDNAKLFKLIKDKFVFDQLIWEGGNDFQPSWVHISYKSAGNRNQKLKMVKTNGKSTYINI